MEGLFSQEDINPDSAIAFADCIADFARVIKKMKANNIALVISQEADQCEEKHLKVSTKLTLKNHDSYDGVDIVVSEKGVHEDDEFTLIDIETGVCEFMRCFFVMSLQRSFLLNWDMTLREFAERFDDRGVMKNLDDYLKRLVKYMEEQQQAEEDK